MTTNQSCPFALIALLLLGACSGAPTEPRSPDETARDGLPDLRGGPPASASLGADFCVFGPQGHTELSWSVTASGRTTLSLWVPDPWAKVGADRVTIDDRDIKGKSAAVTANVPYTFKLRLGDNWKPKPDDTLSFDLMARFPNGAQIHVPNSSCTVPAPPPP